MWQDHIVAEVRKIRDRHAAAFNYDLDAIFKDLKRQEKKSQKKFMALPSKQVGPFFENKKTTHTTKIQRGSSATKYY